VGTLAPGPDLLQAIAGQAAIQKGIATVGVLLWFVSGMALLLVLLGQPWQL
jgi:hypothetical protein